MRDKQNNGRYRHEIPRWVIWEFRLTKKAVAVKAGISEPTLEKVLRGDNVEVDTLWKVVDALNINRHSMTDFKLKERDFRQAVINGKD